MESPGKLYDRLLLKGLSGLSDSAFLSVTPSRRRDRIVVALAPINLNFDHDHLQPNVCTQNEDAPPGGNSFSTASSGSPPSSSSREDAEQARTPDDGWGWIVIFAAFMVNVMGDGISYSIGIIFAEFLDYFDEGKSKTAWIASVFMAMPLLSGPVAGFFIHRYGCRRCCTVGGILTAAGFVASSFTDVMELLFITLGIVAGFGLSLSLLASTVIVNYYFDEKRSLANGLSMCGTGLGTFLFAPLTQSLLSEYGWRGTTLILGGVLLNLCVFGMLMREPACIKEKRKKRMERGARLNSDSSPDSYSTHYVGGASDIPTSGASVDELKRLLQNPDGMNAFEGEINKGNEELLEMMVVEEGLCEDGFERLSISLDNRPTFVGKGEKFPLEAIHVIENNKHLYHDLLNNNLYHLISSNNVFFLLCKERSSIYWWNVSDQFVGSSHRSDQHQQAIRNASDDESTSPTTDNHHQNMGKLYAGVCKLRDLISDTLHLSHFTNLRFLLFALSNFLLYACYDVPYVYLVDNAIERGYSETDGSRIICLIGVINVIGEIVFGWAGDRAWINIEMAYAGCMLLCGAVVGVIPMVSSYTALTSLSGAFGFFTAANSSLSTVIIIEIFTMEKFTEVLGLLYLVQGVANLIGPPLAGLLYDISGSYDLPFYLSGMVIGLSGLLLVIRPAAEWLKSHKICHTKTDDPTTQLPPRNV